MNTLGKLQQAHSKVARVSGQLALGMATKRLKKSDLADMLAGLEQACGIIEGMLRAEDQDRV